VQYPHTKLRFGTVSDAKM